MSLFIPRGLLAGCALLLLFPSVHTAQAAERPAAIVVSAAQIRALGIELAAAGRGLGSITAPFAAEVALPPHEIQVVSTPVAGLVTALKVEENDRVTAGAALLVISSPEFAEHQLGLLRASNRARLAATTLTRERALQSEGIIAARRVQEAELADADARGELDLARAALRLAGLGEQDLARLAAGGAVRSEFEVRAASAGSVTEILARPGQRVSPSDALVQLARFDQLHLHIQVPVAQAGNWPAGTLVQVAGGVTAEVHSVGVLAEGAQSVMVHAHVTSGGETLHPGAFIQVELPVTAPDALEVPATAVVRDGEQAYVFVRNADGFIATKVTVLATSGQRTQLRGGLAADAQIAVSGTIALKAVWLHGSADPGEAAH